MGLARNSWVNTSTTKRNPMSSSTDFFGNPKPACHQLPGCSAADRPRQRMGAPQDLGGFLVRGPCAITPRPIVFKAVKPSAAAATWRATAPLPRSSFRSFVSRACRSSLSGSTICVGLYLRPCVQRRGVANHVTAFVRELPPAV